MDKVTKNVQEGIVREFFYANDLVLVLLGESFEDQIQHYFKWKSGIEEKRLSANVNKMKAFCSGKGIHIRSKCLISMSRVWKRCWKESNLL